MDPRTAETHELPDVGATLAVAFAGDPVLSFLFADPGTRPGLLATFFSARLAGGIGIDETVTVDGLASAAVWVPPLGPDDPGPDFDAARFGIAQLHQLRGRGPTAATPRGSPPTSSPAIPPTCRCTSATGSPSPARWRSRAARPFR